MALTNINPLTGQPWTQAQLTFAGGMYNAQERAEDPSLPSGLQLLNNICVDGAGGIKPVDNPFCYPNYQIPTNVQTEPSNIQPTVVWSPSTGYTGAQPAGSTSAVNSSAAGPTTPGATPAMGSNDGVTLPLVGTVNIWVLAAIALGGLYLLSKA